MIPLIAAKAVSDDIGKGDKGTVMPVINIVNKQVKTSLIITGVVILAVGAYIGGRALYWSVRLKKAEKKPEAKNAKSIYKLMEGYLPPQSNIWAYLNPISGVPTMLKDAGTVVWQKIKDAVTDQEGKIYNEIRSLGVYNITELIFAYNGLYRRDLLKDLVSVLGEENFNKLIAAWKTIDMGSTGFGVYGTDIKVKEGKKITDYAVGQHSAYANKYGLIVKDGIGKYVESESTLKIKDYKFKKGNYAGKSAGFKFGTLTVAGGLVFQDKNGDAGLYFIQTINGKLQPVIAPVDSVLLFDSVSDMNAYATDKKIEITNIKI